jgi:small subunit ribosomal protein S1
MIHVTELGFERVGHPSDMLTAGDVVEVQVKKIERATEEGKRDRIGLSLKALKADPWDQKDIREGARLKGEVVRLESFGAFVKLHSESGSTGVEGLVHVSELGASKRVMHAREVVSVGQIVEVVVLGIDDERRRVALSMKAVSSQEEAQQAAGYKSSGGSFGTFADLLKQKK